MLAVSAVCLLFVGYQLYVEIKELYFYKRNGWDFKKDSGIGGDTYRGDFVVKDSNKNRVVFGRPFMILVFLFFSVGIFFAR
jgi:hypothetical protein